MRNSVFTTPASIAAALLLLLAPTLYAKPSSVTLAELVQKSSVIVFGRLETQGKSAPKPGSGWAPFRASQVLKGDTSLADQAIQLCNSPPPMAEYPDPTVFAGRDVVLFLSKEKEGCFEYSHTTTSVVGVRDGGVATSAIADQPIYQPWNVFLNKLRRLLAK